MWEYINKNRYDVIRDSSVWWPYHHRRNCDQLYQWDENRSNIEPAAPIWIISNDLIEPKRRTDRKDGRNQTRHETHTIEQIPHFIKQEEESGKMYSDQ